MLDRVQQTLEKLAPELDDYRKRMIFRQKEIQKIIETRRRCETKLLRADKKLEDFLNYANLEKQLEKLRNSRIKKLGASHSETDFMLSRNIIEIYKRALFVFSEPILVKEFAEYCIKRKCYDDMKTVLASKCLKNLSNTDLVVYCAQKLWEINDIDGARNTFLKCSSVNSDPRLLVEFFRLECAYAAKLNQINAELEIEEEDRGDIEQGEVALVVFKTLLPLGNQRIVEECMNIAEMVDGLPARMVAMLEDHE